MIHAKEAILLAAEGLKRRHIYEDERVALAVARNLRQLEAAITGAANSGKSEAWYLISLESSEDAGSVCSRVRNALCDRLRDAGYTVFLSDHDPQSMSIVWR